MAEFNCNTNKSRIAKFEQRSHNPKTKPEKEEAEERERDDGVKAEWRGPEEICALGLALSEREVAVLEASESEAEGVLPL